MVPKNLDPTRELDCVLSIMIRKAHGVNQPAISPLILGSRIAIIFGMLDLAISLKACLNLEPLAP
ncbi:hypothetical protein Scep_021539 [Stephania cephalantha]|uniref:Uncharacterized protein n=1 Tax=Stephania cephalantha TaxID=152367 RepID=A0AAP0F3L4_9MAGN